MKKSFYTFCIRTLLPAVLLSLLLVSAVIPVSALPDASGGVVVEKTRVGDSDVFWEFNDGVLTISGSGEIPEWENPWNSYSNFTRSVIIEKGVTTIPMFAFLDFAFLDSVSLPEGLISIGGSAFDSCVLLQSVSLPEGLEFIGAGAFAKCFSLTSVVIPKSVREMELFVFQECIGLQELTVESGNGFYHSDGSCIIETATGILLAGCGQSVIPTDGSVKSIVSGAFCNVFKGERLVIPASVTYISYDAFAGLDSVTTLLVEKGNPVYHSAGNCVIETAAKTMILGCQSSTIPADGSVTVLGSCCFNDCKTLKHLVIPAGVKELPGGAFTNCDNISFLRFLSEEPPKTSEEDFFLLNTSVKLILVPKAGIDAYRSAWDGDGALAIEEADEFPEGDVNLSGATDAFDYFMTKGYVLGSYKDPAPRSLAGMDLNCDNVVDIIDYLTIKKIVLEK